MDTTNKDVVPRTANTTANIDKYRPRDRIEDDDDDEGEFEGDEDVDNDNDFDDDDGTCKDDDGNCCCFPPIISNSFPTSSSCGTAPYLY